MTKTTTLCRSGLLDEQPGLVHGFYGMAAAPVPYAAQLEYVAEQLSMPVQKMIEVEQVHSAKVRMVGAPWAVGPPKADAMVSNRKGLALVLKTADCAPVLLVDPQAGVIGAVHAGWRGALEGILQQTVLHMGFLGAKPERIVASIGPCIAQSSYEVGEDFQQVFLQKDASNIQFFSQQPGDQPRFDLGGYCQQQLAIAGIFASELVCLDTFAVKNQFFSYRRACKAGESDYGRNISVICLDPDPEKCR
ncbi:FIG00003370: Multicopper polyphenol oxidase [hydrothermal vent metagenome]|uniref:FIG00003370: Multicopper polyphenol oxidase n=1 Tax=hydrothermal vent metagenome TaxID=652676 RepID=A0A3B0R9Q8_9ZZZZ